MERWKEIEPGYEVSDLGRVRGPRGVKRISTTKNGRKVTRIRGRIWLVHRLVALAFLPPPPSPAHVQVAHRDGRPANNAAINLRWSTQEENEADKLEHGTHQGQTGGPSAKLGRDQVREIRARAARGASSRQLAPEYGLNDRTMRDVIAGRSYKESHGW